MNQDSSFHGVCLESVLQGGFPPLVFLIIKRIPYTANEDEEKRSVTQQPKCLLILTSTHCVRVRVSQPHTVSLYTPLEPQQEPFFFSIHEAGKVTHTSHKCCSLAPERDSCLLNQKSDHFSL